MSSNARTITLTLTEADGRILQQQIDTWMASEGSQANAKTRKAFQRLAEALRYQAGEEEVQTARG